MEFFNSEAKKRSRSRSQYHSIILFEAGLKRMQFRFQAGIYRSSPTYHFAKHLVDSPRKSKKHGRALEQLHPELAKVAPHLPSESLDLIGRLLVEIPCTLVPVQVRRSKHGDHRSLGLGRKSLITINVCGNRYQFLLTLLHELAHAVVYQSWGWRTAPHGRKWQSAFRKLIERANRERCFPDDLQPLLQAHVARPSSTSFRDLKLQKGLRRYDTLDQRPFVADLAHGAVFSLDGKQIFRLGKKLRKDYECATLDGRKYYVAPTARVQAVY